MNFFINKIFIIREKIINNYFIDVILFIVIFSIIDVKLDFFFLIDFFELILIINFFKLLTCFLDFIFIKLFKEVLLLINVLILNMINLFLIIGYVLQVFKVVVVKFLFKKLFLDLVVLVNYRLIFNFFFILKIFERVVVKQLIDYLQRNGLFEEFQLGFRVYYSIEIVLVKVINDFFMVFDSGFIFVFVLLDFSVVFDIVDYNILLE